MITSSKIKATNRGTQNKICRKIQENNEGAEDISSNIEEHNY